MSFLNIKISNFLNYYLLKLLYKKRKRIISFWFLFCLNLIISKYLKENLISLGDEIVIDTITTDDESSLREAVNTLNKKMEEQYTLIHPLLI